MYHQFFSFWQETEQRFIETFIGTAKETESTLYSSPVLTTLVVGCSVMRRVAELVPKTSLRPPPRFCRIYYSLTILACPICERGIWWKPHEWYPQTSYQFLFADVMTFSFHRVHKLKVCEEKTVFLYQRTAARNLILEVLTRSCKVILGALAKLQKVTSRCHVCLSAWNKSDPTWWIFVKFYIWIIFENLSRKFRFH